MPKNNINTTITAAPSTTYTNTPHSPRPIALITGASRGIGAAIASALGAAGYDLVLTCSQSTEALAQVCNEICSRFAVSCLAIQADMGDPEAVENLFSQIHHLDVLVNNAGISYVGLLSEMSVADWHRVMSANLDSCFYTCRHAIPLMLQKHAGKIVNISSVWGNMGASMEVAYSASKGGINTFTKALARELAPSNIQVNAIACGMIDTAMNACFSEEEVAAIVEEIPADRMGKPEEVAQLVLQTIQAPVYMTGQIITIDGGWC